MFIFMYVDAILATVFAVAALVLLCHRRTLLDLALSGYVFSAAIWMGGNAIADVSFTSAILISASEWAFLGGILSLFFGLLFVDLLIDTAFPPLKKLVWYALPCLILAVFGFTPYAIDSVSFPPNQPAEIIPGILYTVTLFVYIFGLGYGAFRIIRGYNREPDQQRRLQFLYTLTSLLAVMFGQMFFDVLLPVMGELEFFDLGPITSIVFATCCGYAIIRHRLLDIRIAMQRGIIYSLLLILIGTAYVLCITFLTEFLRLSLNVSELWSGIATILLGIFGIPIIERYFRKVTDSFFFKEIYDYAEAMHELSTVHQGARDFTTLVVLMEETVARLLRAEYVRILLIQPTSVPSGLLSETVALSIPIILDDHPIGTITVGNKRSGETYTKNDIRLLTTFALQAATALSLVRLHKEVEQHVENLEHKVNERTIELQTLQEQQRQTMMDISHNLQTPLTIFRAKIEHLRNSLPADDEIRSMEQSVISLSDFIYDLLAVSSLEDSLAREEWTILNLSDLLDELIEEVKIITADSEISISYSIQRRIYFRGNRKRLREVFTNLATNAVKYIGTGDKKQIRFLLEVSGTTIRSTIQDTGVGIPPGELPRVFERFYRAQQASLHSSVPGTGLGLFIVQQIVERHGGSVALHSAVDSGTTALVIFPYDSNLHSIPYEE
jgi:signal transduction histidine kinase